MIVLFIGVNHNLAMDLRDHLEPLGAGVVHYRSPLKALENLSEIDPQAILYAQMDFPRHWKVLLSMIRQEKSKEECIFILFHEGSEVPATEAEKAAFLEVNAILSMEKGLQDFIKQFVDIYLRYRNFPVLLTSTSLQHNGWNMAFQHPTRQHLVNGLLVQIDRIGGLFRPDSRKAIADIKTKTVIQATIKFDSQIIECPIRIFHNSGQIIFTWYKLPPEAAKTIQLILDSARQ